MNLAVVQLRTPLLNVPRARAMMLAAVEQAVKARAEIVLLPELCTPGYPRKPSRWQNPRRGA